MCTRHMNLPHSQMERHRKTIVLHSCLRLLNLSNLTVVTSHAFAQAVRPRPVFIFLIPGRHLLPLNSCSTSARSSTPQVDDPRFQGGFIGTDWFQSGWYDAARIVAAVLVPSARSQREHQRESVHTPTPTHRSGPIPSGLAWATEVASLATGRTSSSPKRSTIRSISNPFQVIVNPSEDPHGSTGNYEALDQRRVCPSEPWAWLCMALHGFAWLCMALQLPFN